jgi:GT2 family glycosyltransferase
VIPVIGIPVLNRGDLLLRCVSSIDYPVGQVTIVNNGNDPGVTDAIARIEQDERFKVRVFTPPRNLGVAASWNWILQEQPEAPFWVLVGNDIQFTPGDLARIDAAVRANPESAVLTANEGYSLMAVTQTGVNEVGYFDENFYPAYYEDVDYERRLILSGASYGAVFGIHAIHGEAPNWGSSTINSNRLLRLRYKLVARLNRGYFRRKWNCDTAESIAFSSSHGWSRPYGEPGLSAKDWRVDRINALLGGNLEVMTSRSRPRRENASEKP